VINERDSDQQLVERVQKGDKRAFDLLVKKYQHRVVALVGRFVRDRDEALDVAQDAFIKAYRALHNFRGDSAFYTWIYRIAINTAKNYLVSQGRRPIGIDLDLDDVERLADAADLRDLASPENLAMRDELEKAVFKAMKELPEDLRMAITLRELDGLSYEEIAEVMDCPVGTVRSRIFRGREFIDQRIKHLIG